MAPAPMAVVARRRRLREMAAESNALIAFEHHILELKVMAHHEKGDLISPPIETRKT